MAEARPGRPLKFSDPQALKDKIAEYFGDCDPHIVTRKVKRMKDDGTHYWADSEEMSEQKPYTISGLAVALETSRVTLVEYEKPEHYPEHLPDDVRDELINTVRDAKNKCEAYAEQHLFNGKAPAGAQFVLKNGYGWQDKQIVESENLNTEASLDEIEKRKKAEKDQVAKQAKGKLSGKSDDNQQPSEATG